MAGSTIIYGHPKQSPFGIMVFVDKRRTGFIRKDEAGFYYTTQNSRGKSFPTLEACKASLA